MTTPAVDPAEQEGAKNPTITIFRDFFLYSGSPPDLVISPGVRLEPLFVGKAGVAYRVTGTISSNTFGGYVTIGMAMSSGNELVKFFQRSLTNGEEVTYVIPQDFLVYGWASSPTWFHGRAEPL